MKSEMVKSMEESRNEIIVKRKCENVDLETVKDLIQNTDFANFIQSLAESFKCVVPNEMIFLNDIETNEIYKVTSIVRETI